MQQGFPGGDQRKAEALIKSLDYQSGVYVYTGSETAGQINWTANMPTSDSFANDAVAYERQDVERNAPALQAVNTWRQTVIRNGNRVLAGK